MNWFNCSLAGTVDSSNVVFYLPCTPLPFSLAVYKNGLFLNFGGDYVVEANKLTFTTAPITGDKLNAQGTY